MLERLPSPATLARGCAYATLISVPTTTAGVHLFGTLFILAALASREFWSALPRLVRNPVAVLALLLWLGLLLGALHTSGTPVDAVAVIKRYAKLLFIPLLAPLFQDERHRRTALWCFAGAVMATVLVSWSEYLGWTHWSNPAYDGPPGDNVFRNHITQGYLFVLLTAVALALALAHRAPGLPWLALGMAGLAALDVEWVMIGRTGKMTLPVIGLWLAWEVLRRRKLSPQRLAAIGLAVVVGLGGLTWLMLSRPDSRLGTVATEIQHTERTGAYTSEGVRLEFYRKGLTLLRARPWTGYGTGSVPAETGRLAAQATTEAGKVATFNMHNEFLMWGVQLGLPGMLAFTLFCAGLWRASFRLPGTLAGTALRGTLVTFVFGSLFNSFLIDFSEGYALVLLAGILLPL